MSGTVARSLGALGDAIGGTANVNFDAGTLFVDGFANNVGIGTAAPSVKLTVIGPSGDTSLLLTDSVNSTLRVKHESPNNLLTYETDGSAVQRWVLNSVERMRIDASGRITMPFQPAFHAFGGSVVSVSISNYILALGSTLTNRGSHYNTSTFRFTAPVAGMYMFAHRVTWGSNGSGVSVFQALNGSAFGGGTGVTEVFGYTSAGGYNTTSASVSFISLNANDFVDLRSSIYNSSAQSLDLSRCSFSGYLIG